MRRLLSTVVLVLVLGGLGAYIYFDPGKTTDSDVPVKEKVFPGVQYDTLSELKIKSQSGDVTTVKKETDGWHLVAPAAAKAAESDVSAIGAALTNLEVTRVIEDKATDLTPYGLDAPQIEVEYKTADGKSSGHLLIGQRTSTAAGLYAKKADAPRVFTIAAYEEPILNKSTFDLRDKAVVSFQRDKIDNVEVVADNKTIQITKDGSDWKLVKPVADRADATVVSGVMDRVETALMKSIVTSDPTPADLKKYGLDKPAVTVTLSQGSARSTFVLGSESDPKSVYARDLSKPLVVTVERTLLDDFKKSVDDYRRKDLFDFRPFNAARVEFVQKGQTIAFERVKGEKDAPDKWRRTKPTAADEDTSKVETMLGGFADLRLTAYAEPKAKTGLDAPTLIVTAKFGDDNREEKVSFAQTGTDVYAGRAGQAGAGKLAADPFNEAVKRLDDLTK